MAVLLCGAVIGAASSLLLNALVLSKSETARPLYGPNPSEAVDYEGVPFACPYSGLYEAFYTKGIPEHLYDEGTIVGDLHVDNEFAITHIELGNFSGSAKPWAWVTAASDTYSHDAPVMGLYSCNGSSWVLEATPPSRCGKGFNEYFKAKYSDTQLQAIKAIRKECAVQ